MAKTPLEEIKDEVEELQIAFNELKNRIEIMATALKAIKDRQPPEDLCFIHGDQDAGLLMVITVHQYDKLRDIARDALQKAGIEC